MNRLHETTKNTTSYKQHQKQVPKATKTIRPRKSDHELWVRVAAGPTSWIVEG